MPKPRNQHLLHDGLGTRWSSDPNASGGCVIIGASRVHSTLTAMKTRYRGWMSAVPAPEWHQVSLVSAVSWGSLPFDQFKVSYDVSPPPPPPRDTQALSERRLNSTSVPILRISHNFLVRRFRVPSDVVSYVRLVVPCAFNDPAPHDGCDVTLCLEWSSYSNEPILPPPAQLPRWLQNIANTHVDT